ncbi:MAG TPA: hypothetical protein VET25_04285 [Aestuariivirgaceae bacterium]|nr:hypothetical protein [Aestuariivirgaceae bacterium]
MGGLGARVGMSQDDPVMGALFGYLGRRGGIMALKQIYSRASRQGSKEAVKHAGRLLAMSQGAMTGAKAQLAKESAEVLYRAGFLDGGE